MLLAQLLNRLIEKGSLTFIEADGTAHRFEGEVPGTRCTVRLHDRATLYKILLYPQLYIGEAFMEGNLTVEDGDIYDFMDLCHENLGTSHPDHWLPRLRHALMRIRRRFTHLNTLSQSRRNVAHHYDLSDALYELFLDSNRQYSCAYFSEPGEDLETAQRRKIRRLQAKLLLKPGQKVLDIGSGWGGLAIQIAKAADVEVTGITLSEEQLEYAQRSAAQEGLSDRVQFMKMDYRELDGAFDRIVSVGMFEHVGVNNYRAFFSRLRELLRSDGLALLHTVGRSDGPGTMNAWMDKYIFPGANPPALSEIAPHIEQQGLMATDIEFLQLHYAETLRAWRQRFLAKREAARQLYDERFCRMWEMYLASCEAAFRYSGFCVFQIQMAREHGVVPMTRDYIAQFERGDSAERWQAA